MTIPITPGPFSFLVPAGEALGRYGAQQEERAQRDKNDARQAAAYLIGLREKGLLSPDAFNTDEVRRVFDVAQFPLPSTAPTPEERLTSIKGRYIAALSQPNVPVSIPGAIPGMQGMNFSVPATAQFSPEQRAVIGAPQPSAIAAERVAAAKAGAQLGEAAPTAVSEQQLAQDKTFGEIADRVVETLYNRNHKLPSPTEATLVGKFDPRASAFGDRINEQYYGAAVERLRAKLEEEKTRRIAALNKGGAGGPIDTKLLAGVNTMIANAESRLKTMSSNALFELKRQQPKFANDPDVVQYNTLQNYTDRLRAAASAVASGMADASQVQQLINEAGKLFAPQAPTSKGNQADRLVPDSMLKDFAKRALKQADPEAVLEAEVQAGRMTRADKAAILKAMQK